jgi:N,N'-diacetyllegionaminate synthase
MNMKPNMNVPKPLEIEGRKVGAGYPAFIAAEVGINHNGDMVLAREMIDAAAEAGADSVKFQNYRTEDFVGDKRETYTYISQGKEITESQYDMFKRCELSRDQVLELAEYCRKRRVIFHSTPTGVDGLQDLIDAKVGVLKNGSDYLSHLGLIRAMGETGLPTVLSTGMAEIQDIEDAVQAFRATGNDKLILLHCTSAYPTPDEDVNVAQVKTLGEAFNSLAGFSDHSDGISAAALSVAYGACWIEKHYTTDKNLPGPDQRFSMDTDELAALVKVVRTAEKLVGNPALSIAASEREARQRYRLSCVAKRDLAKGTVLDKAAIDFKRPGTGVPPKEVETLFGKTLARDVPAGHLFSSGDFK